MAPPSSVCPLNIALVLALGAVILSACLRMGYIYAGASSPLVQAFGAAAVGKTPVRSRSSAHEPWCRAAQTTRQHKRGQSSAESGDLVRAGVSTKSSKRHADSGAVSARFLM